MADAPIRSQVLVFEELCTNKKPVYLRNQMQKSRLSGGAIGDLIIGLIDPVTRRNFTLGIPKNSVVCANDQTSTDALASNNDIRRYIREGVLEVLTEEQYSDLCNASPELIAKSSKELVRLSGAISGEARQEEPTAAAKAIADQQSGNAEVRGAVLALLNKIQLRADDEDTLVEDLKVYMPLTEAEKLHFRTNLMNIPSDFDSIRAIVLAD